MGEFSLPTNVQQIGSIGDGLRIYVEDYVCTYLSQYAEAGGYDERAAFLVGRYMVIDGQQVLFINGAIQGKDMETRDGLLFFTEHTNEYAEDMLKEYFVGMEIVGWMQSQPSYGIYLNQQYAEYHRHVFSKDYQVMLVMDPLEKTNSFYCWNEDREHMQEIRGYFIYYDKNQAMHKYMLHDTVTSNPAPPSLYVETFNENLSGHMSYVDIFNYVPKVGTMEAVESSLHRLFGDGELSLGQYNKLVENAHKKMDEETDEEQTEIWKHFISRYLEGELRSYFYAPTPGMEKETIEKLTVRAGSRYVDHNKFFQRIVDNIEYGIVSSMSDNEKERVREYITSLRALKEEENSAIEKIKNRAEKRRKRRSNEMSKRIKLSFVILGVLLTTSVIAWILVWCGIVTPPAPVVQNVVNSNVNAMLTRVYKDVALKDFVGDVTYASVLNDLLTYVQDQNELNYDNGVNSINTEEIRSEGIAQGQADVRREICAKIVEGFPQLKDNADLDNASTADQLKLLLRLNAEVDVAGLEGFVQGSLGISLDIPLNPTIADNQEVFDSLVKSALETEK